jgi:hypothetical protein
MTVERSDAMKVMDQLEALMLKQGWPVPFTPYYLVHHTKMLQLLDQLRSCLQDEMDGRFIKAFAEQKNQEKSLYQPKKGKERSH